MIEAQDDEVENLRRSFEEALLLLKETRSKSKRDRQYLYELPWYVIIGPPGSGKTTLLSNSGLRFPLSERLGKNDFRGVGGTRNCDWFFAEEAIFLDTAGRYATQDSHQPVDAAGWRGFLDLVKKYRPQRPINGVLVALSIADLLAQDEAARSHLAKAIRQRVLELYDVFSIQFPVYLLFTKCDLIAGFTDFFADLGQEERTQVWGETFPGGDPKQTKNHLAHFDGHFGELLQRLQQQTLGRLQQERDLQRRALILNFPQQIALLKPAIMRFLLDTFDINRFEAAPWLPRKAHRSTALWDIWQPSMAWIVTPCPFSVDEAGVSLSPVYYMR
jgi:type VI secretion system protein ImpL